MMHSLPVSIRLLLEAPLEEGLYLDWAQLLEATVMTYVPPPRQLALAMTLLVHPSSRQENCLRIVCHRILLRTLAMHGSQAFRHVVEFGSNDVGRHGRTKIRRAATTEEDADLEETELANVPLASHEGIFAKFPSFWDFAGFSMTRTGDDFFIHMHLVQFIFDVLQSDMRRTKDLSLDITKSMLTINLRHEGQGRNVNIRSVVASIWAQPDEAIQVKHSDELQKIREQPDHNDWSSDDSLSMRRKLCHLIYELSTTAKIAIVSKDEVIKALATTLAPLPLNVFIRFFELANDTPEMGYEMDIAICNSLLFRLAAYPSNRKDAGSRLVNWNKVYGWCSATPRSLDSTEIAKVEFLKYTIFALYMSNNTPQSDRISLLDVLDRGIQEALQQIQDEQPVQAEKGTVTDGSEVYTPRTVLHDCKRALRYWTMEKDPSLNFHSGYKP